MAIRRRVPIHSQPNRGEVFMGEVVVRLPSSLGSGPEVPPESRARAPAFRIRHCDSVGQFQVSNPADVRWTVFSPPMAGKVLAKYRRDVPLELLLWDRGHSLPAVRLNPGHAQVR